MRQNLYFILSAVFFFSLTAFTSESSTISAVYGVASTDNSQIRLELFQDKTFTFQDFSNPEKPIEVKGSYEMKGSKVKLKAEDGELSFHKKWHISKDGNKDFARKGALFYSLCRLD